MRNLFIYILSIIAFLGCKPKVDKEITFSAGNADFSNTIYLGDNLLSGYTNGGLYEEGQQNSIAKIISTQLQKVDGNEVTQPTFSGNGSGYYSINSYSNGEFTTILNEGVSSGTTSMNLYACSIDSVLPVYSSSSSNITNISCPTLKVNNINTNGFGIIDPNGYNPFLSRFHSGETSYIDFAVSRNPTFFICAFGLSDVLSYIEKGASCGNVTDKNLFENNYDTLISKLTAKTSTGILCEIPNIHKLSFLNANYSFDQDIYIESKQHINNGIEIRKYDIGDQFLRTVIDKIGVDGYGLSDSTPIKDMDVVDKIEKDDLAGDIFNYNQTINSIASKYNLPVVSMENYLLAEKGLLGDSIVLNGTNSKIDYQLGSVISLDGIFPTPRGAAAIANKFITEINNFYDANIPLADINDYDGLMLK